MVCVSFNNSQKTPKGHEFVKTIALSNEKLKRKRTNKRSQSNVPEVFPATPADM